MGHGPWSAFSPSFYSEVDAQSHKQPILITRCVLILPVLPTFLSSLCLHRPAHARVLLPAAERALQGAMDMFGGHNAESWMPHAALEGLKAQALAWDAMEERLWSLTDSVRCNASGHGGQ